MHPKSYDSLIAEILPESWPEVWIHYNGQSTKH